MIVWDGMDIVLLVIWVICIAIFVWAWLLSTIQDKIDKHIERRRKK